MATSGIATKVGIDGEKEYKAALAEISSGLKVLSSEMRKVSVEYADNADSVEALSAKSDVLQRQILSQQEKIDTLRQALEKSAQAYGESDKRTQSWQIQLNNAEAELSKMQQSLKKTDAALSAQTEATEKYSDSLKGKLSSAVQKVSDKLGIDLPKSSKSGTSSLVGLGTSLDAVTSKLGVKLPQGVTGALNSFVQFNPKILAAAGALGTFAVGIKKAEEKLISITKEAAAAADEIRTLSSVTGLSVKDLQSMEYASELLDVSVDQVSDALKEITNKMQEARDAMKEAQANGKAVTSQFSNLGVSITDASGQLRDSKEVFYEVIDALGRVENETERDAIAMDLMSETARNLNPLIESGSKAFKDLADEAESTGYVLDDLALEQLANVDDSFQRLEKSRETFTKRLASQFAPAMQNVFESLSELIEKAGSDLEKSGIVKDFGLLLETAVAILDPLEDIINVFLPGLDDALYPVSYTLATVADTLDAIAAVLTLDWGRLTTALGFNSNELSHSQALRQKYTISAGGNYQDPTTGLWIGNYDWGDWGPDVSSPEFDPRHRKTSSGFGGGKYNAAGTQNWPGGLTWVGENGPELVSLPRGSSISTAQESRSGGDVYYINIDAKSVQEFNDIIRIAKDARMMSRKVVTA